MSRLIFIGELENYRSELTGKRKKQYARLLAQADRYKEMQLPAVHPKESTTYMGIAIVNLALAYRLNGQKTYLEDARRFMQTVLSYEKWGNAHLVNVDLSASWILFGLSLGYDWLKDDLLEEERASILEKIRHHAEIIYQYRRQTYGSGWSTNFWQNHNWINMTGLAAAGYVLQDGRYINEAKDNFSRVFSFLAEDGSNYEGVTYWRYGGMWLFVYAHLLKMQEGIDYFQTSSYLQNTFYYRLYQSCGDLRQQLNYGDCHDRHSGHTACVYYKTAAEYGDGYAQKMGNLVTEQFLMEEARESKVKPGILPEAAFEFLWYDPQVQERELEELPKARYFPDLGLLGIRDSWNIDGKVLTIKCGCPGGKKQWDTGWNLQKEEGLDSLSLSHHHPDNLSYIFARGNEFFTCEDGYNRNLMPDNHNVVLVDGQYTDAENVNDAYMRSVRMRLEKGQFAPENYVGTAKVKMDGRIVIYRGETSGIYPSALNMKEVSRLLFTDGLKFWVFVDVCRSDTEHIYSLICNTDKKAVEKGLGHFVYEMESDPLVYQVFSDRGVQWKTYGQKVESIMTSQEPDKVCRTDIQTLVTESCSKERAQIFYECFSFAEECPEIRMEEDGLRIRQNGKAYQIYCRPTEDEELYPVEITVEDTQGAVKKYYA